ncbi:MAG: T9SS type B sorting domain-containing protein, partial [Paludibacteraceae bacterium]|nr:T9SS type B sorting domain-containing protein [Paludibacteraceae bacterium]
DLPVQTEIGDFNFELQLTTADKCDSTVYLLLHVIPNTNLDVIPAKFVEFRDGRFNWQIKNVEHYPNIHILIYDRFSRKVAEYRGYDNNNGWDGRYNGHLLPATDYWYWMKDDLIKGIITGHFTLYYKQGQW